MPFEKGESGNKATQFKPGQTGNFNGRPRRPVSDLLQKYGKAQSIAVTVDLTNPDGTVEQETFSTETKDSLFAAIAVILLCKAVGGNITAIREVLDRTEGKPIAAYGR
ncbi:DUF5681 domain-containing protein [Spirosoma luteum]|uniref:DUF5681 domain-containing protein n=1 Tax=Spirosoma luteum TaxID=431553 RepID=UPI00036AA1B9|nr:DUF5681 domain-containing protein [Spirosoma luteum]